MNLGEKGHNKFNQINKTSQINRFSPKLTFKRTNTTAHGKPRTFSYQQPCRPDSKPSDPCSITRLKLKSVTEKCQDRPKNKPFKSPFSANDGKAIIVSRDPTPNPGHMTCFPTKPPSAHVQVLYALWHPRNAAGVESTCSVHVPTIGPAGKSVKSRWTYGDTSRRCHVMNKPRNTYIWN